MGDAVSLPARLVLFDGTCGFCSRTVRTLLDADRRGILHFAPLQGATAATIRHAHPEIPAGLDSIVFVERGRDGEVVSWRSEAVFRILRALGGRWAVVALLGVLPRALTDAAYDLVARVRHRLGAADTTCALPFPGVRARFLP
jgi:predicted DCC family thiol-disulfide oxidoreductase YuxK